MESLEKFKPYFTKINSFLTSPSYTLPIATLLLALEAVLCTLILNRIPYTEIDWRAYMQQIAIYRSGERDYTKIYGDTGPLVYGAGHVYLYNFLYKITDNGTNIWKGQCAFVGVYLVALGIVMACYSKAKVPPYIFALLVLSKRLHSIFLLRLFNDCFAVLALFLAIYAYQSRFYTIGSLIYSYGLATKLPLALAGPGIAVVLFQAMEARRVMNNLNLMLQVQIVLGYPFWTVNGKAYYGRAFELGRQFLFKWTVNWRFVGEQRFLSKEFALGLLLLNAVIVTVFALTRWLRPSGMSPLQLALTLLKPLPAKVQQQNSRNINPNFIITTILTSLVSGLLCARSLHYQFYAYIAWSTPLLLCKSGLPSYLIYTIWELQELAWNVYPSTNASSIVVVTCLALQVLGSWWGTRNEFKDVLPPARANEQEHQNTD